MRTVQRTLLSGVLTGVLALTMGVGTAGASTADAGPDTATGAATVRTVDARSGDVITCKITTHLPHYSHHAHADNRHRVNVTADIKCSKSVAKLALRVALYKNGRLYKQSGAKVNAGRNKVSQNAARRCIKRQKYTGYSVGVVTFPPGYTPHTKQVKHTSATVRINACKKR
ncbi:hypothetical protein DDE74_38565 [Streptomyces lydicus]|uniref:Tat pathway signal sequence domain protein n=1 Tax=Streptomyces lydicus TaxID=47763 RepID=A0A3Q9KAU0_9ACTN|nr:hypothetical protein [Streptomyces lydicus]AZS75992.1 hypothetical protein DDE74_38565 [Streptomyces lydicus]